METIEQACELDVDWLEVDVRAARDGALVLSHDRRLPGGPPIPAAGLVELRTATPSLLTLDDATELCRGRVRLLVDVKCRSGGALLLSWLERRGSGDIAVCTASPAYLGELRGRAPWVGRWLTLPEVAPGRWEWLHRLPAVAGRHGLAGSLEISAELLELDAVTVDHWALTPALATRAHALGLDVAAWTLNRPLLARRAERLGADLITTDCVEAMRHGLGWEAAPRERAAGWGL